MTLTNFEVFRQADIDGTVCVKAYDGDIRVIANIARNSMDDYFLPNNLDQVGYADLIRENLLFISDIMNVQYELGQSRVEIRYGSEIRVMDLTLSR